MVPTCFMYVCNWVVSHEITVRQGCNHLPAQMGLKGPTFKVISTTTDRPQFLMGCWPEASLSSSPVDFFTGQLTTWKLTFSTARDPEERQRGYLRGRKLSSTSQKYSYQSICGHILYITTSKLCKVLTSITLLMLFPNLLWLGNTLRHHWFLFYCTFSSLFPLFGG